MNDLLKTRMFSLLAEPSQTSTNEEMQNAYEDLMTQVIIFSHSETDHSEVFRTLNHTRIEFDSLGLSPLYGQGKKCLEICLSS